MVSKAGAYSKLAHFIAALFLSPSISSIFYLATTASTTAFCAMTCQIASFPLHVVSEIIRNVVALTSFEEAQQLRLVNRLFNDEILFAIYVSQGQNKPRVPRGVAQKKLGLVARRALQGHLMRFPHDQWTANVGEAIANLEALASSSETAFVLHLPKAHCYHYLCYSSSASVFDNPISQLVCDALVAYYCPFYILRAIYDFNDQSQKFCERDLYQTYNPSFLILLAACYSGDIIFLQQALNDKRIFTENTDYHTLVSSCLRVASQQGHLRIMRHLLDLGFDINHIGIHRVSAILTAAERSDQDVLKLLLRPEYGLKRSGDQYKFALHAAADHHDTTTRLQNVKTLYLAAEELAQPSTRENLLFRACRSDDMALARWLLADGPVDMYSAVGTVGLKTKSTLHWLAQQGKYEWLQWFLQVEPPQILENDRHRRILAAALSAAAGRNYLEIFLEIAKFFEHNPGKLCRLSGFVEDGLPQLLARLPSLDLQVTLSQEVTESWLHGPNVGSAALWNAISRGRSSNVQMLLKLGVRTSSSVLVHRSRYEKDQTSFSTIQAMLIHHANPVFTFIEISDTPCASMQWLVS